MATLTNILEQKTELSEEQRKWLHLLTGDWQILADIMFADLLLVVPTPDNCIIAAQVRPATASTQVDTDIVGDQVERELLPLIDDALSFAEPLTWGDGEMEYTFIPVSHQNKQIAVVVAVAALIQDRVVSQAHENYEGIAADIRMMISTGEFPFDGTPTGYRHGTPRVTDGVVHLDEDGIVVYASPNAVSNFRRIGIDVPLQDRVLAELVTERLDSYATVDESLPVVLMGRAAWMAEIEVRSIIVSLRAVPLRKRGKRLGAMILCRDISELRRQERELLTKDATIREIHHRVKNNLQTVSALLRMQGRRATSEETRAALEIAQRRVATIALVHEQLSQTINDVVDFDQLFKPALQMAIDIAVAGNPVTSEFTGSFGFVPADQAAALSVVLNEIIANAVEHGLPQGGKVTVVAQRKGTELKVTVRDDGIGISPDGPGSGLGTQIVKTMVASELHGRIKWENLDDGGTLVTLRALLEEK
ncbi:MAG: PAS domain-containing protein [Actinomycetaceae bacterium]|nr:PAS domain-containing protein [Actinomycetaceae bacterium]